MSWCGSCKWRAEQKADHFQDPKYAVCVNPEIVSRYGDAGSYCEVERFLGFICGPSGELHEEGKPVVTNVCKKRRVPKMVTVRPTKVWGCGF